MQSRGPASLLAEGGAPQGAPLPTPVVTTDFFLLAVLLELRGLRSDLRAMQTAEEPPEPTKRKR